jgi:hypothetical protein
MQDGFTPAFAASEQGQTKTLALLLANKADINAASKVQQTFIKILKYLQVIDSELEDFNIAFLNIINDLSTSLT